MHILRFPKKKMTPEVITCKAFPLEYHLHVFQIFVCLHFLLIIIFKKVYGNTISTKTLDVLFLATWNSESPQEASRTSTLIWKFNFF